MELARYNCGDSLKELIKILSLTVLNCYVLGRGVLKYV
jgi:hypothetical protein